MNTEAVGKTYPSTTYAVGREKIKEYAHAVGETNPVHLDVDAARAAGYRDVVAPPMFAAFFAWYAGLARGGVARIGQIQLAQAPLTLLWAGLFLGEAVTVGSALTAVLVVACVAATQRAR